MAMGVVSKHNRVKYYYLGLIVVTRKAGDDNSTA